MKRSEMIKIIGQQLNGNSQNPDHIKEVEALLNVIERAGMLPPFSNNVFYNKWSKTKDPDTNGNDWDPETEGTK